ncbi:MAG: hypothetical protein JNG86_22815 [Verrucomicrobiaceae bacterium]|nr:hypothetical protein [Verrucomicrobiaceae bacterium]
MNTRLFITLTVLAGFAGGLFALTPVQETKNHLEKALSLLTKKEEGTSGKKKSKKLLPDLIVLLSKAEVSLNGVNSNKGTNTNMALKFMAEAKTELEAAKTADEAAHVAKAQTAIQEALKRVLQIIQINRS